MIALLAGTGALPGLLAKRLQEKGEVPLICEMAGFPPEVPDDLPRLRFRIETLGTCLATLRRMGVTRLCLAGAVRRPSVDPAAIDAATAPLVPRLQAAMAKGDDGTLRGIMAILEEEGFAILAAQDIASDLLPPAGILTRATPGPEHRRDAPLAERQLAAMGRADLGQTCVLRAGVVVAQEDDAGTDALLARLAQPSRDADRSGDPVSWLMDTASDMLGDAADWLSNVTPEGPASGGLLFKGPKPGQDRRADLPVIGPATARGAIHAGLAGIVIEAGGVMVLELPEVLHLLDDAGLFLWVRAAGEGA